MFGFGNPPPQNRARSPGPMNYITPANEPNQSILSRISNTVSNTVSGLGRRVGLLSNPEPELQPPVSPPPLSEDEKIILSNVNMLHSAVHNDPYRIGGYVPVIFIGSYLRDLFLVDPELNSDKTSTSINKFKTKYRDYSGLIPNLDSSYDRLKALLMAMQYMDEYYRHATAKSMPSIIELTQEQLVVKKVINQIKYQIALHAERMKGGRSKRSKRSNRSKRVKRSKRSSTKRR